MVGFALLYPPYTSKDFLESKPLDLDVTKDFLESKPLDLDVTKDFLESKPLDLDVTKFLIAEVFKISEVWHKR